MRILYLHGFASSPQSSKAQFFAHKFAEQGIPIDIPALDGGDFEHLTITGQLKIVEQAIEHGPVIMMGSSLGGYLTAIYAEKHPEQVSRVILLAPAFRFLERWRSRFTEQQLAAWKQGGAMPFYHYGDKKQRQLSYQLIEDAQTYSPEPAFSQPGLILHGTKDDVVPFFGSQEFAAARPNVQLKSFLSGHELTDVLEPMWQEVAAFLKLD